MPPIVMPTLVDGRGCLAADCWDMDEVIDPEAAAAALVAVGRRFYARGWVFGTSGNFSVVLSRRPLRLAITASSRHKGELATEHILEVDDRGRVVSGALAPSAETLLHVEIARQRGAGAILHTHSVWSTVVSDRHAHDDGFDISDYEMLKGLDGVTTHEHRERIPIVANDQDMPRLAGRVRVALQAHPAAHAFVLRRHGLYTWGETLADAERHVEVLEFLFETIGRIGDRPRVHRSTDTRVRASKEARGRERRRPTERGTEDNAMALVHIPEEHRTIRGVADVAAFLAAHGIEYERATPDVAVAADAPAAEILAAYASKIADLSARGGYVAADVIDVHPDTPNLDTMLEKFKSEHWHDEDEVRFIIEGHGLFHIHPPGGPVFSIEVGAGDLIRVPKGTHHWFDLCGERRIRAIRLFQDPSGWTPHYTHSGVDQGFQPICFGPAYFPALRPLAGM